MYLLGNKFTINKLKQHKLLLNILIIISFLILSIISILCIWHSNELRFTSDSAFHTARLWELIKSNNLLPRFALNSFSDIGSAVMTMYPYLFFYPSVIIFHIVKSIKYTLYLSFVLWTLITLLISFYSSLRLSHNRMISYIFSLIYALSGEFTAMYIYSPDMGVYFATMVLPLVIFGSIYCLKYNKWLMISIGMSLVLYSNVMSFAFSLVLLLIWFIINYKLISTCMLINIIKASILTILSTSLIWLSMLKILFTNKLTSMSFGTVFPDDIYGDIEKGLNNNLVSNTSSQDLNLFSLLGIILGIIFFKRFPKIIKRLYIFAIFIFIFCSKYFPWQIFNGNSSLDKAMQNLQFTCRLLVVPQLIFEFIMAFCLINHLQTCKKYTKIISTIITILFIILIQISGQEFCIHSTGNNLSNDRTSFQAKTFILNADHQDYWPLTAKSQSNNLYSHNGRFENSHLNIFLHPQGNGKFIFNCYNHHSNNLIIPFLYYHKIHYQCYLDHKLMAIHPNKNQLLVVKHPHLNKGNHYIHIIIQTDFITKLSVCLSGLGLLIYLIIFFDKLIISNNYRKKDFNV